MRWDRGNGRTGNRQDPREAQEKGIAIRDKKNFGQKNGFPPPGRSGFPSRDLKDLSRNSNRQQTSMRLSLTLFDSGDRVISSTRERNGRAGDPLFPAIKNVISRISSGKI